LACARVVTTTLEQCTTKVSMLEEFFNMCIWYRLTDGQQTKKNGQTERQMD